MPEKNVLVIGGGITGLTTAIELAKFDFNVVLIEREKAVGGHARQFTCKATDECVKCGACIVEEKVDAALSHPKISIHLETRISDIEQGNGFAVTLLDGDDSVRVCNADAVVIASGFQSYNPKDKPYGYQLFDDVITNLDLEKMLQQESMVKRPSDGNVPEKIAFIQCVGSRDAGLNHLWCSKVCCGSALRMADFIRSKKDDIEITFFYIDVQTFGKNFQPFYDYMKNEVSMIRAIPGDIFQTKDCKLKLEYFLAKENEQKEGIFDMVVLSVGITPGGETKKLIEQFGLGQSETGFMDKLDDHSMTSLPGVFAAGAVKGPKSIAESVADAGKVALEVLKYFR